MDGDPMNKSQQKTVETEMVAKQTFQNFPVSVDPDVAEEMGAFVESALNASDAEISQFDVNPVSLLVFEIFTTEAITGERVQ